MQISASDVTVGHYSILRYVPDPVRGEVVNIGLFLVDGTGEWARFDGDVPRGILRSMRRTNEASDLEEWIARVKRLYAPAGPRPLLDAPGRIDPETLAEWAREFGGTLQLTPPAPAIGDSLDDLWDELYSGLVLRSRHSSEPLVAEARHFTAWDERDSLTSALIGTMRQWPNFDRERVQRNEIFQGRKARHHVDVAVLNGHVTAVVKALPMVHGTEPDIIAARALILDAAVDLGNEVVKLGMHDPPPPGREDLLVETRSLLTDYDVVVVARDEFPRLEAEFAGLFFPHV